MPGKEPHIVEQLTFSSKINSLLQKDISSAFQVIMAIISRTIFYKEPQAFPNLCVFAFENVVF